MASTSQIIPSVASAAKELQEVFGIEIVKSTIDSADEYFFKILEKCPGSRFTPKQKKAIAKALLVITSAATTFGVSAAASIVVGVVSQGSSLSVNVLGAPALAGGPVLAALIKALPYLATSGVAQKSAASTLFAIHQTGADIAMLKQLQLFLRSTLLPVLPKTVQKAVEKGTEAVAEQQLGKAMKRIFGGKKNKTENASHGMEVVYR